MPKDRQRVTHLVPSFHYDLEYLLPEGPYREIRNWIEEMKAFVDGQGKEIRKLYFFYTTCPRCAKKYGKNYVAILAQV